MGFTDRGAERNRLGVKINCSINIIFGPQNIPHLYQCFMRDDSGAYLASITMEGQQCEHEEEAGRLQLFEHPFNKQLAISEIYEHPFREMWMREGKQTFDPLIQLQTV